MNDTATGMYDHIQASKGKKSRGSLALWVWLTVCALALAAALVSIFLVYQYKHQFQVFLGWLSESTVYAYEHDCLQATWDGQTTQVTGDNLYQLYKLISLSGEGRPGSAPAEAPSMVLDYGDGSALSLWSVKLGSSTVIGREYGLFLLFETAEGDRYSYDTDQLTLETVQVLVSPVNNPQ
jgi:hypothetical protein